MAMLTFVVYLCFFGYTLCVWTNDMKRTCECVNPQDCEIFTATEKPRYHRFTPYCGRNEDGTDRICCEPPEDTVKVVPPPFTKKNSTAIALSYCEKYSTYATDCVRDDPQKGEIKPVLLKEYPHLARLGCGKDLKNVYWCGMGSLISESFILSSTYNSIWWNVKWAFLGHITNDTKIVDGQGKVYDIEQEYLHPKADFYHYGVALYKLKTPVEFNAYIRPACLDTSNFDQINNTLRAASWGPFGPTILRRRSSIPKKADLTVLDHRCCLRFAEKCDSKTMACVDGRDGYAAQDWSGKGSPLQISSGNESCIWTIFAVYSVYSEWAHLAFITDHLYIKVTPILDWIQSIVWP